MPQLTGTSVTGGIRLLAAKQGTALFMAATEPSSGISAPLFSFTTTLTPQSIDGRTPSLSPIVLSQPLPPPPAFDLCQTAGGNLEVTYQVFGGGSNALLVSAAGQGGLKPLYGYSFLDCSMPRFVVDSSGKGAAFTLATAVLDYQTVGLIVPEAANKQGQVSVTTIPLAKAHGAVAFADLSGSTPTALSLVSKSNRSTGPLAPGNLFLGKLALASFDMSSKSLGTPTPLFSNTEFSEFDIAFHPSGVYCLLATTGDGIPILAAFDATGKLLGRPDVPFGSWTSRGRWVTSLTIVTDLSASDTVKFDYAFVEMDGDSPVTIYFDSIAVGSSGIIPPPLPSVGG